MARFTLWNKGIKVTADATLTDAQSRVLVDALDSINLDEIVKSVLGEVAQNAPVLFDVADLKVEVTE